MNVGSNESTTTQLDDFTLANKTYLDPSEWLNETTNIANTSSLTSNELAGSFSDDLLVFDDFNDIFNRINYSAFENASSYYDAKNSSKLNESCASVGGFVIGNFTNGYECDTFNVSDVDNNSFENIKNWWALIFLIVPCLTLFGNVLVILAVVKERTLQNVTNYFIVSLAVADLLVATLVMPFAVYVLVNGPWTLPAFVCDFYIAMDVMCSTSSIFNLVAISIDRYIAVTRPIEYAKHKNNTRVVLTILLVWAVSAAIGSPIVLGLNNTPDRVANLCVFYNTDFIIYSSLSSFYIPCIAMVFLYYRIFSALRDREKKKKANRKSNVGDSKPGCVIENIANTRRFAETALGAAVLVAPGIEEPTNTASGSNEDEDETPLDPVVVISNDKSTEFILATVAEEAACRFNAVTQTHLSAENITQRKESSDGGVSTVTLQDGITDTLDPNSSPNPNPKAPSANSSSRSSSPSGGKSSKRNGNGPNNKQELKRLKSVKSFLPLQFTRSSSLTKTATNQTKKEKKNESTGSRFNIRKTNKASKKKGEKISARKERKATKTLAIVLGLFLVCWVPFFTCNILDAICSKLNKDCQPGVPAFIFTSWLGYMNSFVNPIIYTLFNPEFRKAFSKLLRI